MNRLISLQITDSVYRLTMLFTVLSYAGNGEAVDSETDDRGTPLLIMTEYAPIQKKHEGAKYFFQTLAYPTRL